MVLEAYENAPHQLMSVYKSQYLEVKDIEIFHCAACGHTQIPAYVDETYYQEYAMGAYWGSSFIHARRSQLERLMKMIPSRNRFLDIGCGVGHYLELAESYFQNIYGVEPSETSALLAQQKGYNVINDYFHAGLDFGEGFDAISIIEVLEHLEQPTLLFEQAASLLNDNGVILVEVPNGQRIVEKGLYYNLCTDHIQYFSISSLSVMAHRAGLSILCVQESSDINLLELYARKIPASANTFTTNREVACDRFFSNLHSREKIAAWGAGAEAACFLAMLHKKIEIEAVFDSNKDKHGLSIAGIPILEPTSEAIKHFQTIILFANAHQQQIQAQLKVLGYNGNFITL